MFLPGRPGGVILLAINTDRAASRDVDASLPAERYTLTVSDLLGMSVKPTGRQPGLAADRSLPAIAGQPVPAGPITLGPASSTFLAFPTAGNNGCR